MEIFDGRLQGLRIKGRGLHETLDGEFSKSTCDVVLSYSLVLKDMPWNDCGNHAMPCTCHCGNHVPCRRAFFLNFLNVLYG